MDVNIKDLHFQYNPETPVLRNISLDINENGLVCIIGPNGVGKSTLIKCINKLEQPTSGIVVIDGKDVQDYNLKEMAKFMGYVPASTSDTFSMTVFDTILMGRHPHAKESTREEDMHIVYNILKELNILHLSMRNFDELSAGQHQKVAIARGLAQEPRILILDEPTSNLDIRHQMQTIELLRDLAHSKNILVLMISHELNITSKYADKIVVMTTPGVIYKVGTPEEVITEETIRYVYGVNSEIIMHNGRPHVILDTTISNEEMLEIHKDEDYEDY